MGVNHKRNNISLIAVNLHLGYSGGQLRENLYTGGVCISKILNFKSKILYTNFRSNLCPYNCFPNIKGGIYLKLIS